MYFEKASRFSPLKDLVETTWQSQIKAEDSAMVMPDGTSDIIIKATSSSANIFLCGVMTKSAHFQYHENRNYFGIRFKPGFSSLFFKYGEKKDHERYCGTSLFCLLELKKSLLRAFYLNFADMSAIESLAEKNSQNLLLGDQKNWLKKLKNQHRK